MRYESPSRRKPARFLRPLLRMAGAGAAMLGYCLAAAAQVSPATAVTAAPAGANYDGWAANPPLAAGAVPDPATPERSLGVSALPIVTPGSPSRSLGVSELPYAGWQQAAPPPAEVPFPRHGSRRPRPFDAIATGLR